MDTKLKNVKKQADKLTLIIVAGVFASFFIFSSGHGFDGAFVIALFFSVIVFLVLREYLNNRVSEYEKVLCIVSSLTKDDFENTIKENLGVFEPLKEELQQIQHEVRSAIETEVKSERMKTELITNVSHDLKTPLTAITTYVELLKKEDITQEERASYIETLEKKSARMKVLIEDLFDLSKANSNDVTLDSSNVDIVNLMKQVMIEHTEKYADMGLEVIWDVPEEVVELSLDNQKTYRVFENLFLNIEKYAMKNSRVYIDVSVDDKAQIVIRNMSEKPLHISGEQLTERFVRGDEARNTEGSGLGLAIAKSFVEVQGGTFAVTVDGDLFKAEISFKREECKKEVISDIH